MNDRESFGNVIKYAENEVAPESLEERIVEDDNNWSFSAEGFVQDHVYKMVAGVVFKKSL